MHHGPAATLRSRIQDPRIIIAPGASDALSARIIEGAGAEVVYFTGAGFANSQFAVPDVGLVTMSETVEQVRRITDAVAIPVMADADTGYGGPLNIVRTVKALEGAGVAAIQIEDQVVPKRCGHFDGNSVVPPAEMVGRVRAACDARTNGDVLIIARTDALQSEGLSGAIDRAGAYADAGADMLFVEAPLTVDELREIPRSLGLPLVVNLVEGGQTPVLPAAELEAMGFRVALYANTALRVAAHAIGLAMRSLLENGSSAGLEGMMLTWDERQSLVRLPEYQRLEARYVVADLPAVESR
jgi:2-methylisocitrate lyase-like PEP mutase family enzyme